METKQPLLSEWPNDGDGIVMQNNSRKYKAAQKRGWKHIVIFVLLLVSIGWLCSYVSEFWRAISQGRVLEHEQQSINHGMPLNEEFEKVGTFIFYRHKNPSILTSILFTLYRFI